MLIFNIIANIFQIHRKKVDYQKNQGKNTSHDDITKNSREFGVEISNMDKNKKEIRYPKPSNNKENINNIKTLPINNNILFYYCLYHYFSFLLQFYQYLFYLFFLSIN